MPLSTRKEASNASASQVEPRGKDSLDLHQLKDPLSAPVTPKDAGGGLKVQAPPGPPLTLLKEPQGETEEQIRAAAKRYWERLMEYHDVWGCFPWERHLQPKSSEYTYTVSEKQQAEDWAGYCQAKATLRKEAEQRVPFQERFRAAAEKAGEDPAWYETMLTDPDGVLLALQQNSPSEIVEKLSGRGVKVSTEELAEMSTEGLLRLLLQAGSLTQSCGQTAELIHQVLSPTTVKNKPEEVDLNAVAGALLKADGASKAGGRQYLRVEGGGHAFVIEVFGGRCRILQSFFGRYTLATDLETDTSHTLSDFISLFQRAAAPDAEEGPSQQARTARNQLFRSVAVHPDGNWRIVPFDQDPGAQERLEKAHDSMAGKWGPKLTEPATSVLAQEAVEQRAPSGQFTVGEDGGGWLFYDALDFSPVSLGDLQLDVEYAGRKDGHVVSIKVTQKADGKLTFKVQPSE